MCNTAAVGKAANVLAGGALFGPAGSILGMGGGGQIASVSSPLAQLATDKNVQQAQTANIQTAQAQEPALLRLMGKGVLDTTILGQARRQPSSVAYTGRTLGGG